jgi:hypothetical protein
MGEDARKGVSVQSIHEGIQSFLQHPFQSAHWGNGIRIVLLSKHSTSLNLARYLLSPRPIESHAAHAQALRHRTDPRNVHIAVLGECVD